MSYFFAFLASASIAIAFRGPRRAIWAAGMTGLLGWVVFRLVIFAGGPETFAAFAGALVVGTAGELLARRLKEPALLFVVPGLFPLVPGMMAYNGMLFMARQELSLAGQTLTRTAFYAGALAAGLALPPALFRRWR